MGDDFLQRQEDRQDGVQKSSMGDDFLQQQLQRELQRQHDIRRIEELTRREELRRTTLEMDDDFEEDFVPPPPTTPYPNNVEDMVPNSLEGHGLGLTFELD
jgi:hypothetical protein